MGIDASILSLLPTTSNATNSLLSALYGTGSTGTAGNGIDPVTALNNALKTETKSVAAVAKQPDVARDIAAFRKAVAAAKTPADLLKNPAVLKVLLTANGLGDQVQYPALAQKALLSDTSKTGSLASQLSNTEWLSTAKTFDFANKGLANIRKSGVLDSIANGYAEVQWRTSLNTNTPGLSNALNFRSRAGTITTALQVLGDATLRDVVTTALGIPKQIAFQSLEAQAKAITDRVDLTRFKDSKYVDQFTRRYLVAAAAAASSSGTSSSSGGLGLFA